MEDNPRLAHAVSAAEASGDVEAWITATLALSEWRAAHDGEANALTTWRTISERLDGLRSSYRSRGGRLWAGQLVEAAIGDTVRGALPEIGDGAETLSLIEALRARTLLDEMCVGFAALPAAEAADAAAIEAQLLSFNRDPDLDGVAGEMQLASQLTIGSPHDALEKREAVGALERLYAEAEAGFAGVRRVATAAEVQSCLRPGEVLLETFIPYHWSHPAIELWAVAATREEVRLLQLPLDELPGEQDFIVRLSIDGRPPRDVSPLGNLIVELRLALLRGQEEKAAGGLRLLDELLIAPLIQAGIELDASTRLIVVPHRVLHPLPWAALLDAQGRHLVERTELGLAPSASVLAELRSRPQPGRSAFLGLSDPPLDYAGHSERLPGAREEVRAVARSLEEAGMSCRLLEDEEASESGLKQEVAGKAIVHISTHAFFPDQNAMDTHALLLARTAEDDGVLLARELRSIDLSATWVATLSVCNGGLYRFGPGDEPYGLLRALLIAGASNVLATLWPIADDAAHELTVPFAAGLLAAGPTGALALAERRLAPTWPVRHWASFALLGACM